MTILGISTKKEREMLTQIHSSLQIVLLKFGIDIFDSFETMHFSAT